MFTRLMRRPPFSWATKATLWCLHCIEKFLLFRLWGTIVVQWCIYHAGKRFFAHARIEVYGASYLKNFGDTAIFAVNHASELDIPIICLALYHAGVLRDRMPLIWLVRGKKFYDDMGRIRAWLYGGFLFKLVGGYPVTPKEARPVEDPEGRNRLDAHMALLRAGYSVVIFPEGATTRDGALLPAKAGVAILSEQSQCPVIPMAIEGTFGLSLDDFRTGKKLVRVFFGAPLPLYKIHQRASGGACADNDFAHKRRIMRRARFVMRRIKALLEKHETKE